MKNIFIKTASLCLLLTTLSSCTDYVNDINVDPDNITDSNASNMFQGILLANQFFQTSGNTRDVMIWLNQANGEDRQYQALNNWNASTASSFDDSWNNAYVNCITQAKITELKAGNEANPRLKGAAQVIEAHCMGTVISLWGDAPYSEVDITGNNLTPKYDAQAAVYTSVQKLLDDAIVNLTKTTGKGIPSDKDIYYSGDQGKWLQLAYSLKARFYLHVKDYPKAKTNALLGINNADGDFKTVFGNSYGQSFNPFYSFLVYDRDSYMSGDSYAARLLDPSAALYRGNAKTDESARYAFTYNTEYFSPYGLNIYGGDYGGTNGKFGSDSPMPMVTYGEMLLIIAEVDARTSFAAGLPSYNNYRGMLNTGYSIGIDNSGYDGEGFSYAAYNILDFTSGGIENPAALTNQDALLREIFQERYIYFMGNYESLNDFGRSNNLAVIQLKPGYAGTPQRLLYPQVEINSNPNTPNPIPTIVTKTPVHN
ncbi:SusD/RagB family nutrient-binding outer membrane lipoprotein [Flavobacterium sp. ZS1P70]|uniref:SusD/RagB family nutrient-binding outer membrane lipoprotein n=1 Tax=Flavobacterium zhoui TaxID=3230414 RepID=A0ABW6I6Z7_9FLAO